MNKKVNEWNSSIFLHFICFNFHVLFIVQCIKMMSIRLKAKRTAEHFFTVTGKLNASILFFSFKKR